MPCYEKEHEQQYHYRCLAVSAQVGRCLSTRLYSSRISVLYNGIYFLFVRVCVNVGPGCCVCSVQVGIYFVTRVGGTDPSVCNGNFFNAINKNILYSVGIAALTTRHTRCSEQGVGQTSFGACEATNTRNYGENGKLRMCGLLLTCLDASRGSAPIYCLAQKLTLRKVSTLALGTRTRLRVATNQAVGMNEIPTMLGSSSV